MRLRQATVMGIDPSTSTGVCVLNCGGRHGPKPTVVAAQEIRQLSETGIQRARMIASAVGAVVSHFPYLDLVVIEGYALGNRNSLVTLVEIGTLIRSFLHENGRPFVIVAPTQLKKFVLGRGSGKKDEMRLGVYKRWGFEHSSDNIVDAYGLAAIGLGLVGVLPGLIKPQEEVISKLPAPTVLRPTRRKA